MFNNFLEDQNQEGSHEEDEEDESEEEGFQNSDKRNIENVIKSKKEFLKNIIKLKEDVESLGIGSQAKKEGQSGKKTSGNKGKHQQHNKKGGKE